MAKEFAVDNLAENWRVREHAERLIILVVLFFLGHAVWFGTLAPFGLAFLMAEYQCFGRVRRAEAAAIGLGGILSYDFIMAGVYAAAFFGADFFFRHMTRSVRSFFSRDLLAAMLIVFLGGPMQYFSGGDLYGQAAVVFNGALYLLTVRLFAYGIGAVKERTLVPNEERDEVFICLLLIFAVSVIGMGNVKIADFSLAKIAGSCGIMAAALIGGISLGAVAGAVVGSMMMFSGADAAKLITLYSLSGILGGALKELGKNGVCTGFGCGSLLIALWYMPLNSYGSHVIELSLSMILFLLLPLGKLSFGERQAVKAASPAESAPDGYKIFNKLQALADVFGELGKLPAVFPSHEKEYMNIDEKISAAIKPFCTDCERYEECWEKYGYQTYKYVLNFFAEKRPDGRLKVPFGECPNSGAIKQNMIRIRLEENSRSALPQLMKEQMRALGEAIKNISYELESIDEEEGRLAASLTERCKLYGCNIDKIAVSGTGNSRKITLTKSKCHEKKECIARIKPLAEDIFGCDFSVSRRCANYPLQKKCCIVLETKHHYTAEVGWASIARDDFSECGDIVRDIRLPDGRLAVCLSDGMGSGSGAAEESRLVQAILQKLLRNDFGIDLTMQLLNVLLMVNSKENFAAIDLVIFNLSDGCVKFLKAAAAPSYIKRVREIKQVEVASLPVGIIYSDLGESGCLELKLSGDDYLVLVSDGIEDMKEIKYAPSDREGWFIRYLRHMEEKSPEEMAKSIVEEALRLCNGRPDDDLSVAVISLKKNTAAK